MLSAEPAPVPSDLPVQPNPPVPSDVPVQPNPPVPSAVHVPAGLPGPQLRLPHSWDEARARAYDCVVPLPAHSVPLDQGIGRILAQDITALQDIPHYASSAMDGWSVAGSAPWIMAETGHRLTAGQAAPVVTGGLIPAGARAVLRSESGRLSRDEDGLPVLVLSESARPGEPKGGQHIRRPAEEASAGEVMVRSGQRLNPVHIAVAALAGLDEVRVLGQPAVKLVFTGDEVVSAGLPGPGQVRDTFSPQLAAVVRMLGGSVLEQQRVADNLAAMTAALEDRVEDPADVIITTGATGRSSVDFLRAAVAALGGTTIIDGIAMRPGHPTLLAEFPDGRLLVGLPGNPLAAMMGLLTVAAPLLARLGSRELPALGEVFCGSPIPESPGRTRLLPYRLVYGLASPTKFADSGMLRGLAAADGVMLVPPHGAKMGETVTAIPLPWQLP